MNICYTDDHLEYASDLYDLRKRWQSCEDIRSPAVKSVEDRLVAHITHLAQSLNPGTAQQDPPPKKEGECFAYLACRMNAPHPDMRMTGYDLACQWLTQAPAKAAAAEAALSLYPPQDNAALLKLYEAHADLRPALFRIFRQQMAALPQAMINAPAMGADASPALKIEALRYAAVQPGIGLDIFRTHYTPLLSGLATFDPAIIEAALWGGMVRGDEDATRALMPAITHTGTAQQRLPLLRLAALTGQPDFLPLLLQTAENDATTGYPLLSLYGHKSVIPELLKAMEAAHTLEAAALAFTRISDEILPLVPRLSVVGDEEEDDEGPQIPDVQTARDWWAKQEPKWKEGERWIGGKPATPGHLHTLAKKHAGSDGIDLMALLALSQQTPLNIAPESWRMRQFGLMANLASAPAPDSTANAPQPAAKPAKRFAGFFSKKSASAPAPTPPAASAQPSVAITGLGIACHAGNQPYALITSVLGQMSAVQMSKQYIIKASNGNAGAARIAPVKEFAHHQTQQRFITLSATALAQAAAQLPAAISPENVLVVMLAGADHAPDSESALQHLQHNLTQQAPRLAAASFRILPHTSHTGAQALHTASTELNEGKWHAVIFGGSDTLISMETCLSLAEQKRLNVAGKRSGLIPGEAAAFIVLQGKASAANNLRPALAHLRGVGYASEPHARQADIEGTQGLVIAIQQAMTQAGMEAGDLHGIINNLGAETVHAFEWYQVSQKLWPRKASEQQRMAVQLGEIERADLPDDPIPTTLRPHLTMGETGAAALPMQIATALAWLEYDAHQVQWGFPVRQHLLVCDTPDITERGALILSTESAG